ncbi:hypothetical protein MAR_029626 [Mya arenaria]|uniref:Uncharacterized protein n=1 Tax=Mya arenaria TaxID=6604 RepID=A0ABY7DK06_MYAAR|nr:uncharacterized protein LOC128225255 [Mya arenaria]WAQ96936.1 hypothetical protein MAR_029626 [Mya arenaria]
MAFAGIGASSRPSGHFKIKVDNLHVDEDSACGCLKLSPSRRSVARASRMKMLRERIRQFSIWYSETEEERENYRFKLRKQRQELKLQLVTTRALRFLRWLYGVAWILAIVGGLFVLCSSIKVIGGITPFYKKQKLYRGLGVCFLALGMIILLVATGVKHKLRTRENKPRGTFYIVEKNKRTKPVLEQMSSFESEDSGNVEDMEIKTTSPERQSRKRYMYQLDGEHESSLASAPPFDDPVSRNTFDAATDTTDNRDERARQSRRAWAKSRWMREEWRSSRETEDCVNVIMPEQ